MQVDNDLTKKSSKSDGPLSGVLVVEACEWVAGSAVGTLLSDWGADVVKIERRVGGDALRGIVATGDFDIGTINHLFELSNRGKRSLAIDLQHAKAAPIIKRLLLGADVFLTNYRKPALNRLGLSHDDVKAINPRLVYAHVTAFGHNGPDADTPGMDTAAFWARTGLAMTGESGNAPLAWFHGVGDNVTGGLMAAGVCAALLRRELSDQGQYVTTSLFGAGVWANGIDVVGAALNGIPPSTARREEAPNPLWNVYQAKDGKWLQLVMAATDAYWSNFCDAVNLSHLREDPRFHTHEGRSSFHRELIGVLDQHFATRSREEWTEMLRNHDLVWAPVQTPLEVARDLDALGNGYVVETKGVYEEIKDPVTMVSTPVSFDKYVPAPDIRAPELGQQTEEILLELGFTWDQISEMKSNDVVI